MNSFIIYLSQGRIKSFFDVEQGYMHRKPSILHLWVIYPNKKGVKGRVFRVDLHDARGYIALICAAEEAEKVAARTLYNWKGLCGQSPVARYYQDLAKKATQLAQKALDKQSRSMLY